MANGAGNIKQLLGLRQEMSIGFYLTDFLFRVVFRQNAGVGWAVHHTATIHCPDRIRRGRGVFPGDSPGVYINAQNGVELGDYVNLGPNVGIISANHNLIDNNEHISAPPIRIGKHSWIGIGAVVLPSVVLGDFTIVGAGAIVTKSFPEGYCVLAGNPARLIKTLNRTECDAYAASKQ